MPGRLEDLPIDSLVPNPWNPNEQDPETFDMLVRRMRQIGVIAPVQVVALKDGTYQIIGGEHRWKAAKAIGYATIPAIILTDARFESEDLRKLVTMQLNMIGGKLNPEKFLKMYSDLSKRYDDKSLKDLLGFTKDHQFKLLTKGIADGLPDDMKEEFERRAASAKGDPEALQKILTDLMGKYGDDLRCNFMILSHEGREHVWLKLNGPTHIAVKQVLDLCRTRAIDINTVLEEAFVGVKEKFT